MTAVLYIGPMPFESPATANGYIWSWLASSDGSIGDRRPSAAAAVSSPPEKWTTSNWGLSFWARNWASVSPE